MIFLSDIKGTITAVVPSPIYQGSSDADEFVLIAPFPRQSVVCVAITLPNGQIIAPRISTNPDTPFGDHAFALELLESFSDKLYNAENIGYNAWRIKVNAPLTQYGGNLSLQFLIATGDGVIKTTSSLNVNIGRGTPYIMPQDPEGWNQVLDLLSGYNTILQSLEDKNEWDYVITSLEDFTTEKLATMSGRVLVNGVNYLADSNNDPIMVSVPSEVEVIKFVNSIIYCSIRSDTKNTKIIGLQGSYIEDSYTWKYTYISGFGAVEDCTGRVELYNCENIRHCNIHRAYNCANLTDIECRVDYVDGNVDMFVMCTVLDNIRIYSGAVEGFLLIAEFNSCSHISNVHNMSPEGNITVDYDNCTYVDGDTCDGYYTEEDAGKVALIEPNGKSMLSDLVVIKGRGDDSVKQSKTGAKALGDRCAAFNASVSGCLGYRYKAIDLIDKKIYLTANNEITGPEIQVREISTEILDNVIEDITLSYAVGDKFTLKMRSYDLDNVGTITAINGNEITYDNTFAAALSKVASQADLEGSSLKAEIQKADTYIDRYSFSVPLKADKGELVVSEDAVSFGTSGNIATGRHSISAGRDNLSVGDFSTTFGRGCEAWYGSLAVGYYMKALGDRCAAVGGAGVTVRGDHGFGTGNTVTVEENALCGFGAGMFNSVTNPFETVFGRASASKSGSIFRIGNGALSYSEGSPNGIVSRSNAFVVFEDGHAEIYVDPVNTDSLVRLGYLPFRKATYSNSLCSNTSGAEATKQNSIAWGIDAKAKGSPSFSLGESCVVDEGAHYGLGIGRGVHIKSYATQGIGFFLDTFSRESGNDNCFQFIVGAFNAPLPGAKNTSSNEGARFIVGNGTGTNHRSNSFVSWGDGRATIGADPTDSMDVVPKHMYDELLARVVALEQAIN